MKRLAAYSEWSPDRSRSIADALGDTYPEDDPNEATYRTARALGGLVEALVLGGVITAETAEGILREATNQRWTVKVAETEP